MSQMRASTARDVPYTGHSQLAAFRLSPIEALRQQ